MFDNNIEKLDATDEEKEIINNFLEEGYMKFLDEMNCIHAKKAQLSCTNVLLGALTELKQFQTDCLSGDLDTQKNIIVKMYYYYLYIFFKSQSYVKEIEQQAAFELLKKLRNKENELENYLKLDKEDESK